METTPTNTTSPAVRRQAGGGSAPSATGPSEVTTVRGGDAVDHRGAFRTVLGISAHTAGAGALSLNVVTIPPGAAARPHRHVGVETAVYIVSGEVETRYGPDLGQRSHQRAGDFVFIPPGVPHQPVNLSGEVPAVAVVAHSTGDEAPTIVWHDAIAAAGADR